MFCPKCAAQNIDGASFCRACGANISLVPQALTGQLPEAKSADYSDRFSRRRRKRGEPTLDQGIRSLMMGIGFIVVSVMVDLYSPAGWTWWYWMLIPAAMSFAKGFSVLARLRMASSQNPTFAGPQLNTVRPQDLPAAKTGELMTPVPSVTEGTTRHLGVDATTRKFDSFENQKPS